MDPKIIKATQDSLGKIIRKPPLTEKLLGKPPFRFLHDVMTSVIKTTGFMQGLFTDEEMNSENVKDKDRKMTFLQKVVDFVSLVNEKQLHVRPSKIVAGHEAEKTNILLQSLAEAINKNVNNEAFVNKFLKKTQRPHETPNGQHQPDTITEKHTILEEQNHQHKTKPDETNTVVTEVRSTERKHRSRSERHHSKPDDRDLSGGPKAKETIEHQPSKHNDLQDTEHKSRKHKKDTVESMGDALQKEQPLTRDDIHKPEQPMTNGDAVPDVNVSKKLERPSSAKGSRRRKDGRTTALPSDGNATEELVAQQLQQEAETQGIERAARQDPPTSVEQRSLVRPSSARPAPPQVKKTDIPDEPAMRMGSGRPAPIIVESDQSDNEDEFFLVDELNSTPVIEPLRETTQQGNLQENAEDHGGLVKKLLETKKELDGLDKAATKKPDIERLTLNDAARRKEREMIQKDVDKLRSSIQSFTRCANPLGKVMDYVQEDLDSMQAELREWTAENKRYAMELTREQGITEQAIEPLRAQLTELDAAIQGQIEKIAAVKSNIYQNDKKIDRLLRGIANS